MKKTFALAAVGIIMIICMIAWGGALPSQYVHMNVQLRDINGAIFPAGDSYCLKFVIYSDQSRSEKLWESIPESPASVTEDGYINVTVGAIPGSVFDDGDGTMSAQRFIQVFTCEYLLVGDPYPIPWIAQAGTGTVTRTTAIVQKSISLLDTHGDTVFYLMNYGGNSKTANLQLKMLDDRVKALEARMR